MVEIFLRCNNLIKADEKWKFTIYNLQLTIDNLQLDESQ